MTGHQEEDRLGPPESRRGQKEVERVRQKIPSRVPTSPPRVTSPLQDDLRLSGPPSGQGRSGGVRTRDRRVPADLRAGFAFRRAIMESILGLDGSIRNVEILKNWLGH
ncbi:hypothetical protein PoB_002779000 [Plakobranchus ocellatus]|uniref:Uncharacterized protein n=1 Tax=Plakobranchus ocellatus TaxID=259542 RepID=A0AAV3ZZJ4_9GAST|nr:hypothetical protein PoB_002779000 [Plakobranchus ocellatus]